jgi:hypothetical protein
MSIIWFLAGFLVACFLPDVVDQYCKRVVINVWKKFVNIFHKGE